MLALGITWILDGLEVTLAGALSGALKESPTLHFSNFDVGLANSVYLAGAVLGALGFGWLTDRIGRKKLFFITLAVYLSATAATALSWSVASYALFRFLTGAGIGGEYTAINSTIQELVPARYRGWTDSSSTAVSGSARRLAPPAPSCCSIPPSPVPMSAGGWLISRAPARPDRAGHADVDSGKPALADDPRPSRRGAHNCRRHRALRDRPRPGRAGDSFPKIKLRMRDHTPLRRSRAHAVLTYRQRSLVGLTLMVAQAFFYNAIFFTFALVLTDFYGIPADQVGWYILPFAAGNFLGPLLLGRLFDTLGRRVMITLTYGVSGVLLAVSGYLFSIGVLSAQTQTSPGW